MSFVGRRLIQSVRIQTKDSVAQPARRHAALAEKHPGVCQRIARLAYACLIMVNLALAPAIFAVFTGLLRLQVISLLSSVMVFVLILADFKGKVVILDFWAIWCLPCVKEISHFIELYTDTAIG